MWRSKKQNVVVRSSAKAEFRLIAHGICEVLWIKKVLEELKITIHPPAMMYCDNKAAISIPTIQSTTIEQNMLRRTNISSGKKLSKGKYA